jgi:hypothetical protein
MDGRSFTSRPGQTRNEQQSVLFSQSDAGGGRGRTGFHFQYHRYTEVPDVSQKQGQSHPFQGAYIHAEVFTEL